MEVLGKPKHEELLLSPESIVRIYEIHDLLKEIHPVVTVEIPHLKSLMGTLATATTTMATAAKSMAATVSKAEDRYARLEERLQAANDKASGKGQIPIYSHYATVFVVLLIAVLMVLYMHKQTIEATLTSVKVSHPQ